VKNSYNQRTICGILTSTIPTVKFAYSEDKLTTFYMSMGQTEDFFLYENTINFKDTHLMVNSVERTAFMKSQYSEIPSNHCNPDSHECPARESDNSSYYSHHTVHQHGQQLKLIFNSEIIS